MTVEEDGDAVLRPDPPDLRGEGSVIGSVVVLSARCGFGGTRRLARFPDVRTVEVGERDKARGI